MGVHRGIPRKHGDGGDLLPAAGRREPAVKPVPGPGGGGQAGQTAVRAGLHLGGGHAAAVGVKCNGIYPFGAVCQCVIARAVGGTRYLPVCYRGGQLKGNRPDNALASGGQVTGQTEVAAHRQRTLHGQ